MSAQLPAHLQSPQFAVKPLLQQGLRVSSIHKRLPRLFSAGLVICEENPARHRLVHHCLVVRELLRLLFRPHEIRISGHNLSWFTFDQSGIVSPLGERVPNYLSLSKFVLLNWEGPRSFSRLQELSGSHRRSSKLGILEEAAVCLARYLCPLSKSLVGSVGTEMGKMAAS